MATPKFDLISVQTSQLIGDPVSAASSAGAILTANERTALVNRAMFKLFDEGWGISKGDIAEFLDLFPELLTSQAVTTDANGEYTINSTVMRDLFVVVSGLLSTTYIKTLPRHYFTIVKASKFDDFTPDSSNPVVFEISGKLSFFPSASFNAQSVTVYYIKVPLNPTDGSFLTQGGTYDSPFSDQWDSKIAEIALDIYRSEAQEKSQ